MAEDWGVPVWDITGDSGSEGAKVIWIVRYRVVYREKARVNKEIAEKRRHG
jgi:hypothetical protein